MCSFANPRSSFLQPVSSYGGPVGTCCRLWTVVTDLNKKQKICSVADCLRTVEIIQNLHTAPLMSSLNRNTAAATFPFLCFLKFCVKKRDYSVSVRKPTLYWANVFLWEAVPEVNEAHKYQVGHYYFQFIELHSRVWLLH